VIKDNIKSSEEAWKACHAKDMTTNLDYQSKVNAGSLKRFENDKFCQLAKSGERRVIAPTHAKCEMSRVGEAVLADVASLEKKALAYNEMYADEIKKIQAAADGQKPKEVVVDSVTVDRWQSGK
jgi:hypothetical protein